jgi:hypothetical protein
VTPRGAIADEFLQIATDDRTGAARLDGRTFGLALAAALLAELVFCGRLLIRDRVVPVPGFTPGDALSHLVLEQIEAEPEVDNTRARVEALSYQAQDAVVQRLWRHKKVKQPERRMFGRQSPAWKPVDGNQAAWTRLRLTNLLDRSDEIDDVDSFLLCLCHAASLRPLMISDASIRAQRLFDHVVEHPVPAVRHLIDHTAAAIGSAVLTNRT